MSHMSHLWFVTFKKLMFCFRNGIPVCALKLPNLPKRCLCICQIRKWNIPVHNWLCHWKSHDICEHRRNSNPKCIARVWKSVIYTSNWLIPTWHTRTGVNIASRTPLQPHHLCPCYWQIAPHLYNNIDWMELEKRLVQYHYKRLYLPTNRCWIQPNYTPSHPVSLSDCSSMHM